METLLLRRNGGEDAAPYKLTWRLADTPDAADEFNLARGDETTLTVESMHYI
jgi:hypothetical protein